MNTFRPGTKRTAPTGRERFACRLQCEQLETRVVPSQLRSGTILVATSPNADPNSPAGIVAVDPQTGAQNIVSSGGAFSEPIDLREGPDGQLYVTDFNALTNGAVFRVNPDTGAQTVISTGGVFLAPTGIQPLEGKIYVADEGTATEAGDIVRVDPQTGAQRIVASGGDLCAPDGLTPGPDGSLYVVDFNALTTGAVFQIDVRTGAQRLIATGGAIDAPVDVSVDFRGNLVVSDAGVNSGESNLVRIDPRTGAQTFIASGGDLVNVNASTLGRDGRILVSSYEANDGSTPAAILSVNPRTGRETVLTQGGNLDFLGGLIVYQHPDDASGGPGAGSGPVASLAPFSVDPALVVSGTPDALQSASALTQPSDTSPTGAAGQEAVPGTRLWTAPGDSVSTGALDATLATASLSDGGFWENAF